MLTAVSFWTRTMMRDALELLDASTACLIAFQSCTFARMKVLIAWMHKGSGPSKRCCDSRKNRLDTVSKSVMPMGALERSFCDAKLAVLPVMPAASLSNKGLSTSELLRFPLLGLSTSMSDTLVPPELCDLGMDASVDMKAVIVVGDT